MQTTRTPYSISFMATVLLLLLFACHSTVANAAVALGATRVIYPANQKQVFYRVASTLVVGDYAITQRGVITVGVAIHLTAINGSISIRRLNVTLFPYAHG